MKMLTFAAINVTYLDLSSLFNTQRRNKAPPALFNNDAKFKVNELTLV